MILIVEGSNKVGKTTLINSIMADNEDAIYIRQRPMTDIGFNGKKVDNLSLKEKASLIEKVAIIMQSYVELLTSINRQSGKLYIIDRFHLTELAYGQYYRGYYNNNMYFIDYLLNNIQAKMVLVKSDYTHLNSAEYDYDTVCKYSRLQQMLAEEYKSSKLDKIQVKYEPENVEAIKKEINELLKRSKK